MPSNATNGLPSLPLAAVSLLLVNRMASGATWLPETDQWPPASGLVASNVPLTGFGTSDLMPFQATVSPDLVMTASGSVVRKNVAIVADGSFAPFALTGESVIRRRPGPSVVHRTCTTPSLPRTRPTSSMMSVLWGVILIQCGLAAGTATGLAGAAAATPLPRTAMPVPVKAMTSPDRPIRDSLLRARRGRRGRCATACVIHDSRACELRSA